MGRSLTRAQTTEITETAEHFDQTESSVSSECSVVNVRDQDQARNEP